MKGCFSAVHLSVNDFRKAGCRTSVVYDEEASLSVRKKVGKSQRVSCCIVSTLLNILFQQSSETSAGTTQLRSNPNLLRMLQKKYRTNTKSVLALSFAGTSPKFWRNVNCIPYCSVPYGIYLNCTYVLRTVWYMYK